MTERVSDFLDRRILASDAFSDADPTPFLEILTENDPATYLSPRGELISGAANVRAATIAAAERFDKGGTNHIEVLGIAVARGALSGYWFGEQFTEMHVKGSDILVPMNFFIAEEIRVEDEDGLWRTARRYTIPRQ